MWIIRPTRADETKQEKKSLKRQQNNQTLLGTEDESRYREKKFKPHTDTHARGTKFQLDFDNLQLLLLNLLITAISKDPQQIRQRTKVDTRILQMVVTVSFICHTATERETIAKNRYNAEVVPRSTELSKLLSRQSRRKLGGAALLAKTLLTCRHVPPQNCNRD